MIIVNIVTEFDISFKQLSFGSCRNDHEYFYTFYVVSILYIVYSNTLCNRFVCINKFDKITNIPNL